MLARCPHCGARFDTDEGGPLCRCRQEHCEHREIEVKWKGMPDDLDVDEGFEPIVVDVECKECGEEGEATLDITIREVEWKRG